MLISANPLGECELRSTPKLLDVQPSHALQVKQNGFLFKELLICYDRYI